MIPGQSEIVLGEQGVAVEAPAIAKLPADPSLALGLVAGFDNLVFEVAGIGVGEHEELGGLFPCRHHRKYDIRVACSVVKTSGVGDNELHPGVEPSMALLASS